MRTLKVGLAIVAVAAIGVTAASPAWASDTFTLINNTGQELGISGGSDCEDSASADFPSGGYGGVFGANDGPQTVTLTGGDCPNDYVVYPYWVPYADGPVSSLVFDADDPFIDPASLSCYAGYPYPTPSNPNMLMCEPTGHLTATMSLIPGANASAQAPVSSRAKRHQVHTRFASTLAVVGSRGVAMVSVMPYSLTDNKLTDKVILRDAKTNDIIGTGTAHLTTGKRGVVRVKLPASVANAATSHKGLVVRAEVIHLDGTTGTGDIFKELTLWRNPS